MTFYVQVGGDGWMHIQNPEPEAFRRLITPCPTCKRRTRKVAFYTPYYGWDVTCCACGDCWDDEYMRPRPFRRGWRQQAIKEAKQSWKTGKR